MTRPIYETAETLKAEEGTISRIASVWGVTFRKLPVQYRVDWALERDGRIVCWVESKKRKNLRTRYPSLMLSLSKVMHGLDLAKATGLPFVVVVEWVDALAYLRVERIPPLRFGGRADRGDWQDVEPVVDFPVEDFKIVC